jgi:hypothetical protein
MNVSHLTMQTVFLYIYIKERDYSFGQHAGGRKTYLQSRNQNLPIHVIVRLKKQSGANFRFAEI